MTCCDGARGVPDLGRIKGLARRLGAVTRQAVAGDTEGDASFVQEQRVTRAVTLSPLSPAFRRARQKRIGSQPEKPPEINLITMAIW
jgi:hypothetical protein